MLYHMQAILTDGLRQLSRTKDKNFLGFDQYPKYGAYHWKELTHNATYRRKLAAVTAFVCSEYSCLDLGCGDEAYVYGLSSKCKHIIGIDADYDAMRLADTPLKAHAVPNCRCIQMPIRQVTLKKLKAPRPFDLAYAMDVLEHLPDPCELLRVAGRLVTPPGLMLIGTPLFVSAERVSPYHVRNLLCKPCARWCAVTAVFNKHVSCRWCGPRARRTRRDATSLWVRRLHSRRGCVRYEQLQGNVSQKSAVRSSGSMCSWPIRATP
jgi:2-polyprenyl-3-methyl-5-hydroxy-6-metoxy-1,4-benzoquinol methylase